MNAISHRRARRLHSHRRASRSGQRGYTLIEVIVAFALLAVGLGILLAILAGGVRQVAWAGQATRAALYADTLMSTLGADARLQAGQRRGEFEHGNYRWTMQIVREREPVPAPNAAAGECAVALGLTGPAFAVGGGPHGGIEALAVAADLVRGGVADRIVVVGVDEAGAGSRRVAPATLPGAVALLVAAEPLAARLESWSVRLPAVLGAGGALVSAPAVEAHRALLPLASSRPEAVEARTPWGGFAIARFFWL